MKPGVEPGMFLAWVYGCNEDLMEALSKVAHLPKADPENYHMVEADFVGRRLVVVGSDAAIKMMAKANGRCGNG